MSAWSRDFSHSKSTEGHNELNLLLSPSLSLFLSISVSLLVIIPVASSALSKVCTYIMLLYYNSQINWLILLILLYHILLNSAVYTYIVVLLFFLWFPAGSLGDGRWTTWLWKGEISWSLRYLWLLSSSGTSDSWAADPPPRWSLTIWSGSMGLTSCCQPHWEVNVHINPYTLINCTFWKHWTRDSTVFVRQGIHPFFHFKLCSLSQQVCNFQ